VVYRIITWERQCRKCEIYTVGTGVGKSTAERTAGSIGLAYTANQRSLNTAPSFNCNPRHQRHPLLCQAQPPHPEARPVNRRDSGSLTLNTCNSLDAVPSSHARPRATRYPAPCLGFADPGLGNRRLLRISRYMLPPAA
jgi:hypothetical protein